MVDHPSDTRSGTEQESSLTKETATDRVYLQIRAAVLNERYSPGARLKEDDLADDLGVSRTPIRGALMRLVAEGMLDYVPNQGVRIASWSSEDLNEIFRLRAVLESHGAELAARHIGPSELDELRHLNSRMAELEAQGKDDYLVQISDANNRFHKLIYRSARSARLEQILSGLIEIPLVIRSFRKYKVERLRQSIEQHAQLIHALEAGDPEWAGAVMKMHILAARNTFQADPP